MVHEYARSGALLGGEEAATSSSKGVGSASKNNGANGFSSSGVDWGKFRGSPATAMEETLAWLRMEYGSVDAYLNHHVGFEAMQHQQLRTLLRK